MTRLRGLLAAALLVTAQANRAQGLPAGGGNATDSLGVVALNTTTKPRPFYAIAHRVLMDYGVRQAVAHGANALETDLYPWKDQWYADHDGTFLSKGSPARVMFETVAAERMAGKNIVFVWLDIKKPDKCGELEPRCNIEALRDLARRILQPAGVRVLYGFYDADGRAYSFIREGLNSNEAIGLEGNDAGVHAAFEAHGPWTKEKRVMSKGLFYPGLNFGDCNSNGNKICPTLRQAVASQAYAQIFGWTISWRQKDRAHALMGEANVDGLVYGFMATHYHDDTDVTDTLGYITTWLKKNPDKRYLETIKDKPW